MQSENQFNEALGIAIKAKRKEEGSSQEELAIKLGLTRTSVTNIESGSQKLSVYTLYCIAYYLGVHPDELLTSFSDFKRDYNRKTQPKNDKPSDMLFRTLNINRSKG